MKEILINMTFLKLGKYSKNKVKVQRANWEEITASIIDS